MQVLFDEICPHPCIIAGDFNVNLIYVANDANVNNFFAAFASAGFIPHISRPTRITSTSVSLLDNIWTNFVNNVDMIEAGLILNDLSDHLPVFSVIPIEVKKALSSNSQEKILYRKINNFTILKLVDNLSRENWDDFYNQSDINKKYEIFINKITRVFDMCCPEVKSPQRQIKKILPWMTPTILQKCKLKEKLYCEHLLIKNETSWGKYKQVRNEVTTLIRKAKINHNVSYLEKYKNDMKKTWLFITDIMGTSKRSDDKISNLGKSCEDLNKLADDFNKFFIDIGKKLAKNMGDDTGAASAYLSASPAQSCVLLPVTSAEILAITHKMVPKKSNDYDNLNMFVIKQIMPAIVNQFCQLSNEVLLKGVFPDRMKVAKVIPIFKSGDVFELGNYRPISLLPQFSKILEKLIANRMQSFLDKNNLLNSNQYGFRKGRNTESAIIDMMEHITDKIDSGRAVAAVFVDLKKAFDSVHHGVLLAKLAHMGFRGLAYDLIKNYLSNRKQFVELQTQSGKEKVGLSRTDHVHSLCRTITCGVPQGSVLGPLLFLIYINDLPNCFPEVKTTLFADDTNLAISALNPWELEHKVNLTLAKLSAWLQASKICLNIKKTKIITFSNNLYLNCSINSERIEVQNTATFLGLIVDNSLYWKPHIDNLAIKISKTVGIIGNLKNFLPSKILLMLYNSLVKSKLDYAIEIWGSTSLQNLKRLKIIQKRAMRHITRQHMRAHAAPLFATNVCLNLDDLYKTKLLCLIFRINNGSAPPNLIKLFKKRDNHVTLFTRSMSLCRFVVKQHRTTLKARMPSINGVKLWNQLPGEDTMVGSIDSFRKRLTSMFLGTYI